MWVLRKAAGLIPGRYGLTKWNCSLNLRKSAKSVDWSVYLIWLWLGVNEKDIWFIPFPLFDSGLVASYTGGCGFGQADFKRPGAVLVEQSGEQKTEVSGRWSGDSQQNSGWLGWLDENMRNLWIETSFWSGHIFLGACFIQCANVDYCCSCESDIQRPRTILVRPSWYW